MQTVAFILSGFASIPLTETRQPKTLPLLIMNMHFSGLSFNCVFRMLAKSLLSPTAEFPSSCSHLLCHLRKQRHSFPVVP
jgi:hypothetical protein